MCVYVCMYVYVDLPTEKIYRFVWMHHLGMYVYVCTYECIAKADICLYVHSSTQYARNIVHVYTPTTGYCCFPVMHAHVCPYMCM